ncbi:MAG: hypothetical protein LBU24_00350 [Methanocalculaceae archaeon]|jgi:hypothetical protein|nr:hypothetical protein [Methanocalculaceae archaeon]
MTSTALASVAKRAAQYTVIRRKNQLSKLCWYATGTPCNMAIDLKDPSYLIA